MSTKYSRNKQLLKRWDKLKTKITVNGDVNPSEPAKAQQERIERARGDYDFFCSYYFPHYTRNKKGVETPNAPYHNATADKVLADETIKGIIEWYRGSGKSVHFNIFIPLWLKIQKTRQLSFMLLIGKSEKAAIRQLQGVQAELQFNPRYINDYGEQLQVGNWDEGDFIAKDGTAFLALGMGQSPRGARNGADRPDLIVADDLDDNKLSKNPARVTEMVDWIMKALIPTMDIGVARFFLVNNRISKNSILSKITDEYISGWRHFRIHAQDAQGEPTWKKYTRMYYDKLAEVVGWKAFQTEYMNDPKVDAGRFKLEYIRYKAILPISEYERVVAYFDPSFRSGRKSDFKAIKIWGKTSDKRLELHCIDAFCRQCEITEAVQWLYDFHESLTDGAYVNYMMEGKFIQEDFLEDFELEGNERGYQLPIEPDNAAKGDKDDRIESIIPYWSRGFTFYNVELKNHPDMRTAIDQTTAWDRGSSVHDDSPDADHGAIRQLLKAAMENKFPPRIQKRQYGTY